MSFSRALPLLSLAVVLAGCASAPPPPIAVSGPPSAVANLAGNWVGDYRISDGSRRGLVTFDLSRGDSVATGNVIMQPASLTTVVALAPRGDLPHPAGSELTVKFVQVANDMVRGQLDPYTEPECACPVLTVFEGHVKGDRIEGTFSIRNTINGDTRTGTWSVVRKR
jgi:hypothetical protein